MCGQCQSPTDDAVNLVESVDMLDALLDGIVEPVTKAIDISTGRGFDRAVALLAARLRKISGPADADAVRAVIPHLDIDWAGASKAERSRAVNAAIVAAKKATALIPTQIRETFGGAADDLVRATRKDGRTRQRLSIAVDFNALDKRIVKHLVGSQGNFVRDEYGKRIDVFGAQARAIVAAGLERGLGRDDISGDLQKAAETALVKRSASYWDVIASAFTGNARSYAQMSSYAEAGVSRYRVLAVLDEVTTPSCRFLDGKEFGVGTALERFSQIEKASEPEAIKSLAPWIRESIDKETGSRVLWVKSNGTRVNLAETTRSGVGARDDRGDYRQLASDKRLDELGIGFPPYHGHCRSTTLAVV